MGVEMVSRASLSLKHDGEHEVPVQQMPRLNPSYMWPRRNAKVAEALYALAQVDYIAFDHTKKVHGVQVIVLSVYLKRQPTRIPTNRTRRASADRASVAPDYQLEKTFRDLQALRHHSGLFAQRARRATCEYCTAFHELTHAKFSHAKLSGLFWPSSSTRKKIVEGFVNAMVDLCVDGLWSLQRSHYCQGFENIPVRVQRFLRRVHTIDRLY